MVTPVPDALDRAGEFGGGRKRRGRLDLVFAGDDQRVEKIQRGGVDSHHRLAGSGLRLVDIGEFKVVGRAVAGAEQGFHGAQWRLDDGEQGRVF